MRLQVISKYKTAITVVTLVVAAGLFVPRAMAADDATLGETLADTCLSCHGSEDYRSADSPYRVPKLGGQKAYRNGNRQDPVMVSLVSTLSDDAVALLAKYFSSLERLRTTEVK